MGCTPLHPGKHTFVKWKHSYEEVAEEALQYDQTHMPCNTDMTHGGRAIRAAFRVLPAFVRIFARQLPFDIYWTKNTLFELCKADVNGYIETLPKQSMSQITRQN